MPDDKVIRKARTTKKVIFEIGEKLERCKFFRMDSEPNAPGLTYEQVDIIQQHLQHVPFHSISSELKTIEKQMDRKKLEEHKNSESRVRQKLQDMKPQAQYKLRQIKLGDNFKLANGKKSMEE